MMFTIAESSPDMGLLTPQAFCFCPNILARANTVPIMTTLASLKGTVSKHGFGVIRNWHDCKRNIACFVTGRLNTTAWFSSGMGPKYLAEYSRHGSGT